MYAGFLNASQPLQRVSYIVAESEGDPATDPVVVWMNGGPLCSSFEGFAQENGPFIINQNEDLSFELTLRPQRWSRWATVVWFENPTTVGFSYFPGESLFSVNDSVAASRNADFMQEFYKAFPQWEANDLFIVGESYAGVYVPMLALELKRRAAAGQPHAVRPTGIAVGNGCIGKAAGVCADTEATHGLEDKFVFEYFKGQAFLPPPVVASIEAACSSNWASPSQACDAALLPFMTLTSINDPSDLYTNCNIPGSSGPALPTSGESWTVTGASSSSTGAGALAAPDEDFVAFLTQACKKRRCSSRRKSLLARAWTEAGLREAWQAAGRDQARPNGPCASQWGFWNWFKDANVTAALNLQDSPAAPQHSQSGRGTWSPCSGQLSYQCSMADEATTVYPKLVQDMRVLIYNGNFDSIVPWTDNVAWTYGLELEEVQAWHAWYVTGGSGLPSLGGHAVYWGGDQDAADFSTGLAFTTVHAAGHMVPRFQPLLMAHVLRSLLEGQRL